MDCDPFTVAYECIYLLREREFVTLGAPVYKLGRTVNWINRMNSYPKGSEVYLMIPVDNSVWYENQLISIFEDIYERATVNDDGIHTIGNEYFVGNLDEMIYIITTFIHNHYPKHFVQYTTSSDYTADNTEYSTGDSDYQYN